MQTQTEKTPSLSDLFAQMNELNKPNMASNVSQMTFGSIDPNALKAAFISNGSPSSAANFGASEAWTMTPEMFKQTLANRPDALAEAGKATSLSDAIFGKTAQQKALVDAHAQDAGSRRSNMQTAGQLYTNAQDLSTRVSEGALNRANQMDIQKLQEAGADRRNAAQIGLQREKMDRELMILKDSVARGEKGLADLYQSGKIFFNPELEKESATMYDKLQNDKKSEWWKRDYEYLKKMAYGGASVGAIVPLSRRHQVPTSQGTRTFDYAILGQKGWVYGNLDRNNKFIPDTSGIAVPMTSMIGTSIGQGGSAGGAVSRTTNRYAK